MSRTELHGHLRDPQVHLRRTGEALVTGLGTVLIAPAKMPPTLRRSLHGATALSGLVGGALALGESTPMAQRLALGSVLGGGLLALSVAGVAVDLRTETWLRRRGVRHPRWVMGAVLGTTTLALLWSEDLFEDADEKVQPAEG